MKKLMLLTLLGLGACSKRAASPLPSEETAVTFVLLNSEKAYPLERAVRLEFSRPVMEPGQTLLVRGYMKCCASPLRIVSKDVNGILVLDIDEFWGPGEYAIEFLIRDDQHKVVSKHSVTVQAR